MNTIKRPASCLATIAMAIVLVSSAWSQAGSSTVSGTVNDPQGSAIAGATVTLAGNQGTSRTAVTNENGAYSFNAVQPGEYRIEVEMTGFKKASVAAFKALTDFNTTINVGLEFVCF